MAAARSAAAAPGRFLQSHWPLPLPERPLYMCLNHFRGRFVPFCRAALMQRARREITRRFPFRAPHLWYVSLLSCSDPFLPLGGGSVRTFRSLSAYLSPIYDYLYAQRENRSRIYPDMSGQIGAAQCVLPVISRNVRTQGDPAARRGDAGTPQAAPSLASGYQGPYGPMWLLLLRPRRNSLTFGRTSVR